jgi:hypothetical protein
VPAAAVIPAPIAYIKVVAVKKLVVGFRGRGESLGLRVRRALAVLTCRVALLVGAAWLVYCEKIRVFNAGMCREYISME